MKKLLNSLLCLLIIFAVFGMTGCSAISRIVQEAVEEAVQEAASPSPLPTLDRNEREEDGREDETPSKLDPSAESTPKDGEDPYVPFSEMQYERPDTQELISFIESVTDTALAGGYTDDELFDAMDEVDERYDHYITMMTLAMIYSDMDYSDQYWVDEYTYTSEGAIDLGDAYTNYADALESTPYKDAITDDWDDTFFENAEDSVYQNDEVVNLFQQIDTLENEYDNMMVSNTISYNGKEMNLSDIQSLDSYNAYEAMQQWMDTYREDFGNLYVDMIKLRNQAARSLGYENYIELQFDLSEMDYTAEQAQNLLDNVANYLGPVYEDLIEVGFYYAADDPIEFSEGAGLLQDTFTRMDAGMGSRFRYMLENGLCDYEIRSSKLPTEYTTYLVDYKTPFMTIAYNEDLFSLITLIHEFGHFNDMSLYYEDFMETTDMSEVYSTGLSAIAPFFLPDNASARFAHKLQYNALSELFSSLLEQGYYASIEFEAYALNDSELTPDTIERIVAEQAVRFRIMDTESIAEDGIAWMYITHLFESPFYVISYVTSSEVSIQLWDLAFNDREAAMDVYNMLLERSDSEEFLANIEAAGLYSPFEEDELEYVAWLADELLVKEDWDIETFYSAA